MKKLRILTILLLILISGGCSMTPSKEEMREVVETEECINIIEDAILRKDENAFTDKGFIKTYEIDFDNLEWSPMGSIFIPVYVNNQNNLMLNVHITKRNGVLLQSGWSSTTELYESLEKFYNE